jgi:hypothetical protein
MDAETHNIPSIELNKRGRFSVGTRGLEAEACTPPGVLLKFFGG